MKTFLKNHSLSISLAILFIAMSVAYWFTGIETYREETLAHGETFEMGSWVRFYVSEMLVSNLADVFGAIVLVIFTKKFFEKDSNV